MDLAPLVSRGFALAVMELRRDVLTISAKNPATGYCGEGSKVVLVSLPPT